MRYVYSHILSIYLHWAQGFDEIIHCVVQKKYAEKSSHLNSFMHGQRNENSLFCDFNSFEFDCNRYNSCSLLKHSTDFRSDDERNLYEGKGKKKLKNTPSRSLIFVFDWFRSIRGW